MVSVRTAAREELEDLLAFEHEFVDTAAAIDDYVARYGAVPETFLVAEDPGVSADTNRSGGPMREPTNTDSGVDASPVNVDDPPWDRSIVGVASGAPGDPVEVAGIGVRTDRRGEGIGRRLLAAFEERAAAYGSTVGAAAAGSVEGFYLSAGYTPKKVLLRVPEASLPADYERRVPLLAEGSPVPGQRFLYVEVDEYEPRVREGLRRSVCASQANTIFEKPL